MRIGLAGLNIHLEMVALAGVLLGASHHAHAGALNRASDPDRIPGKFIVVLKRDHIASLKNPVLTDPREIAAKSEKWKAAKAAADSEVAQIVRKLHQAHPHVEISAVMSRGRAPGFVLHASDEEAKAIADEDDVAEVDADIAVDAIKNATMD